MDTTSSHNLLCVESPSLHILNPIPSYTVCIVDLVQEVPGSVPGKSSHLRKTRESNWVVMFLSEPVAGDAVRSQYTSVHTRRSFSPSVIELGRHPLPVDGAATWIICDVLADEELQTCLVLDNVGLLY